jgi:hypothetical protein
MSRHLVQSSWRFLVVFIAVLFAFAPWGAGAEESSWIFLPSHYTHSPVTGLRVAQYQPEEPAVLRSDPTYQESGYRHQESTIGFGSGADHVNVVQTWGLGTSIRPYGEWEYPYRPGATPYGPWGMSQGPGMPGSWQNPMAMGSFWQGQYGPGQAFPGQFPQGQPRQGSWAGGQQQPGPPGPMSQSPHSHATEL